MSAQAILELDPPTYLRQVLPALLAQARTPALRDAVIQFLVVDREDCDLCYRFSSEGLQVQAGISDQVDLTLAFLSADLLAFSRQQLDVPRALRTKRLKVHGDPELLAWMSARLADAATGGAS